MAQFVIMGQVGKTRKYYAFSSFGSLWSPNLSEAVLFNSQSDAEKLLTAISEEPDQFCVPLNGSPSYKANSLLRTLTNEQTADVKLSICVLGITPISVQRWHVEDGKGKTKRLS